MSQQPTTRRKQQNNKVKEYSSNKNRSCSPNTSSDKKQHHRSNSSISSSDEEQYTQDEYSTDDSNIINESNYSEPQQPYKNNNSLPPFSMISASIFVAFVVIMGTLYNFVSSTNQVEKIHQNCSFEMLGKKYPNQRPVLWESLKIGIEGILNGDPAVPGVYLFLHENNTKSIDLIQSIARISSNCFDPKLKPLELKNEDFNTDDYGNVITKYKNNIGNGGVLIVANLNEIPGTSAQALHTICDTYSPLVKRVVIFLDLRISSNDHGNPIKIAEDILTNMWKNQMRHNTLDALLARITDSVLRLKNEVEIEN